MLRKLNIWICDGVHIGWLLLEEVGPYDPQTLESEQLHFVQNIVKRLGTRIMKQSSLQMDGLLAQHVWIRYKELEYGAEETRVLI